MFGSYQQVLQDNQRNQSMSQYVTGHDRPIYFKRPLVPQMSDMPIIVAAQPRFEASGESVARHEEEVIVEAKTRDVEVQTVYRESEAQTDPFTPKYLMREGERPEVLLLEHLKWGHGLPVSIDELEAIESSREKTWFENSLPPISDEASFALRRRLMEEQELREWKKKEDDIKQVQNEKLYLQQSALIEREKDVEDKNAQRIEEIKIKKTEQKNRLIAKIQRRKIKVLRKMLKSRKLIDTDTRKREIIEQYANFASKVYAGITREGLSLDKIANKYEVMPVALTTYPGMQELSDNIKPQELETKVNVKRELRRIQKQYTRMEDAHRRELRKAEQQIQLESSKPGKEEVQKEDAMAEKKKYGARVRPATPTWKSDNEGNLMQLQQHVPIDEYEKIAQHECAADRRQKAVLLMQRLLRGRSMQNIMYEGKEKRMALIDELLTVAKIQNIEPEEQEEILLQNHEEKVKNAVLEALQGEVIAETLDVLSKELLRIKQERKIAALVDTAERDRRLREIQEAGRRQAEEKLREREDVVYNEILRVHQGTVDTYLDWIFTNTVEKASTRQATIMANLRQDKMNKPLEAYERKFSNNETIIKDLVHAFLIPNVQRSKIQRQIEIAEKRFNEAAKKSLQQTMQKASNIQQQQNQGGTLQKK